MRALWSEFKLYAGLAVAGLIGALYFMVGHRTKQRDEQRRRAEAAQRSQQATQKRRETEQRTTKAQNEARQANAAAQEERDATPKADRRTGSFGSSDRL